MVALRSMTGAMFALAIAASPALACKGDEIFSDDFNSPDGPWQMTDNVAIGKGSVDFKTPAGGAGAAIFVGEKPKEFDMCIDVTFPQARNPDGGTLGGILFWLNDFQNMYLAAVTPVGALGVVRFNKGRVLVASPFKKQNALKAGAGAKNTIRVSAKGNTVTVYGNDQRLASLRGVPEEGYLGLYAESEKEQSNEWQFSNFKLTEAPK